MISRRTALIIATTLAVTSCGSASNRQAGQEAEALSTSPSASTTLPPSTTTILDVAATCTRIVGRPAAAAEAIPGVAFSFAEGVTGEDRAGVEEGIRLAQAYIASVLGGMERPACFDVKIDEDKGGTAVAMAQNNTVSVFTRPTGWAPSRGSYPSWHLRKTAAHEYTHIWQASVRRASQINEPVWLSEGAAELVGYRSLIERGLISEAQARAWTMNVVSTAGSSPLQNYERLQSDPGAPPGTGLNYGLAFFAAEYLTLEGGAGTLLAYWTKLGQGAAWQDAFTQAFGITPSGFYEKFESYRSRGFRD